MFKVHTLYILIAVNTQLLFSGPVSHTNWGRVLAQFHTQTGPRPHTQVETLVSSFVILLYNNLDKIQYNIVRWLAIGFSTKSFFFHTLEKQAANIHMPKVLAFSSRNASILGKNKCYTVRTGLNFSF